MACGRKPNPQRESCVLKNIRVCGRGLGSNFPVSDILSGMFVGS